MIRKIIDYFKKRPGLVILIAILSAITLVNIKPDFYFMGWDNYSSYFNLKTNIFRTFFATWREYRGLGVPSDSESTDVFRQLFFLILSPFVKQGLLDQIFSLFSFNLGVILIYLLSKKLFKGAFQNNEQKLDLIGAFSGLFYIFNLNTLATFYFPMIMYINRFYAVPLLFYIFLNLIQERITWKKTVLFSLLIIFSSGAYMTATIFITVLIALMIFLLLQSQNIKKSLIFILFFIVLNSFWLLPFINYTINKSNIVYQAPTFIDANEIQLNKPASFYSLGKQLILYPNFFDTRVTSFNGSQTKSIHFLGDLINHFPYNLILWILPFLYLTGAIYLVINYKKYKKLIWIAIIIFLYLFLSLKAYSPFGFIYIFLERNIPFFSSLFRFGDTKFHYFIAFSGSLLAGFFVVKLSEKLNKRNLILLFLTLFILFVFVFNSYFNGHFFGFFNLNKVPEAYFEIANIINQDKDDYRVLHLPFNQDRYWRSYNWGYLGSSFFHFLVDKPLLEKTFEPASQENIELNREIYDKISKKSEDLYLLLKKTGVKYIIFDESVTPQITTKGLGGWGIYNYYDSKRMIDKLVSERLIFKVASYNVNIDDYMNYYEKVFSLNQNDLDLINKTPNYKIELYQLKNPDPKFRMVQNYKFTDPKIDEFNIDHISDTLQVQNINFVTIPFKRKDIKYVINNGQVETELDDFNLVPGNNYKITTKTDDLITPQTKVEIYGRVDEQNLYLEFYNNPIPEIVLENQILSSKTKIKEIVIPLDKIYKSLRIEENLDNYLSNWNKALSYKYISGLRIKIGKYIIPFPSIINTQETYFGSLVLNQETISIQILKESSESLVDLRNLILTDNANCFLDSLQDYSSTIDYNNGFNLENQNGSTCFTTNISNLIDQKAGYIEVKLNYQSQSFDIDSQYLNTKSFKKPTLLSVIKTFPKPNYLFTCIKDANIDDCFNTHQTLNLTSGTVIIPTEKEINAYEPILFFALKNIGYQRQSLTINDLIVKKFEVILKDELEVKLDNTQFSFTTDKTQNLKILFKLPLNYYSFYQSDKDGFSVSNGVCSQSQSYRTIRKTDKLVSYFENCDNNFFVSLNFDSINSYIWLVDYNLASGKFPRFNLGDDFNKYTNQILSLYQGYPDIESFKSFQNPEIFTNKEKVLNQIDNFKMENANIILPGAQNLFDQKKKNFMIAHDSENEAMALYDNFNVIQIPNTWINLSIGQKDNSYIINHQINNITYQRILPSLWKVSLDKVLDNKILYFNEGYDKQWGIYKNLFDLVTGKKSGIHYKCNNYANCFKITSNKNQFYVFYAPEKLYFLGWTITLFSLAIFLISRKSF